MKTCFIIASAGGRTEYVANTYIVPACRQSGYAAILSEKELSNQILNNLVNDLTASPMALAYIGERPWNANVMLEVGYRLGRFEPLVILCDETKRRGADLHLPFNISDERVITLPQGVAPPRKVKGIVQLLVARIKEAADNSSSPIQRASIPVVRLQVENSKLVNLSEWQFVEASKSANEIFGGRADLVGKTLEDFYNARALDMPSIQYKKFMTQQKWLIGNLAQIPEESDGPPPLADVPIHFDRGPMRGRSYRPVVVTAQQTSRLWQFLIAYVDVTGGVTPVSDPAGEVYQVCNVGAIAPALCSEKGIAGGDPELSIFLSYAREDARSVEKVYERLQAVGAHPWMDKRGIQASEEYVKVISDQIEKSDAALVFLSNNAKASKWMGTEWMKLVDEHQKRNVRLMPVLLEDDADLMRGFPFMTLIQYVAYDQLTNDWLTKWIGTNTGGSQFGAFKRMMPGDNRSSL